MAIDPITAASLAAITAGTIGSLVQKRPKAPDISGELARLRDMYAEIRKQQAAGIESQYQDARGQVAANLAGRGVYRSPVAEHSFTRLRTGANRDIAASNAAIGAQEANSMAAFLAQLLGINVAQNEAAAQRRAAIFSQIGGLGGALLPKGATATAQPPMAAPTSIGTPNFVMQQPTLTPQQELFRNLIFSQR